MTILGVHTALYGPHNPYGRDPVFRNPALDRRRQNRPSEDLSIKDKNTTQRYMNSDSYIPGQEYKTSHWVSGMRLTP
jgi:hypothetical protein